VHRRRIIVLKSGVFETKNEVARKTRWSGKLERGKGVKFAFLCADVPLCILTKKPAMSPALAPVAHLYPPSAPVTVWAMRPALAVAESTSFAELRQERARPVSLTDKLFLKWVRSMNQVLQEFQQEVLRMDAETAQASLSELSVLPGFGRALPEMRSTVGSAPLPPDASEVERELWRLVGYVVSIHDDLQLAALDVEVDEDSADYQAFLQKTVADIEAAPATHGRKALFALLED